MFLLFTNFPLTSFISAKMFCQYVFIYLRAFRTSALYSMSLSSKSSRSIRPFSGDFSSYFWAALKLKILILSPVFFSFGMGDFLVTVLVGLSFLFPVDVAVVSYSRADTRWHWVASWGELHLGLGAKQSGLWPLLREAAPLITNFAATRVRERGVGWGGRPMQGKPWVVLLPRYQLYFLLLGRLFT